MLGATKDILLIEDDQPTTELYCRELSREYHVFACADEHAALDLLKTQTISAVVLEPALSGGTRRFYLGALKEACAARSIPIIVCSTLDKRQRDEDVGAVVYLVKPVPPATLHDTLRRVIRQG